MLREMEEMEEIERDEREHEAAQQQQPPPPPPQQQQEPQQPQQPQRKPQGPQHSQQQPPHQPLRYSGIKPEGKENMQMQPLIPNQKALPLDGRSCGLPVVTIAEMVARGWWATGPTEASAAAEPTPVRLGRVSILGLQKMDGVTQFHQGVWTIVAKVAQGDQPPQLFRESPGFAFEPLQRQSGQATASPPAVLSALGLPRRIERRGLHGSGGQQRGRSRGLPGACLAPALLLRWLGQGG
jgi:hypothetical protein